MRLTRALIVLCIALSGGLVGCSANQPTPEQAAQPGSGNTPPLPSGTPPTGATEGAPTGSSTPVDATGTGAGVPTPGTNAPTSDGKGTAP